jgi:hypothetical protein
VTRARFPRGLRIASLALALTSLVPGCGPRVVQPPTFDLESVRERYVRARAEREARLAAAEAPVMCWATLPGRKLPAVDATVRFGGPDSVKVEVNGVFGFALEASALSDSVTVWVPSRRAVLRADAQRDSLGVQSPGTWLAAALGAIWAPPDEAWRAVVSEDSTLVVAWRPSDGLRRRMNVGASGLPTRCQLEVGEGRHTVARYTQWRSVSGVAWPMGVELTDGAQSWRVRIKVERVRFLLPSQRGRLDVQVPEGAQPWSWARLRDALAGSRRGGG